MNTIKETIALLEKPITASNIAELGKLHGVPDIICAAASGKKVSIKDLCDSMEVEMEKIYETLKQAGNIQFNK